MKGFAWKDQNADFFVDNNKPGRPDDPQCTCTSKAIEKVDVTMLVLMRWVMIKRWGGEWYLLERSLLLRRTCPEVLEQRQECWRLFASKLWGLGALCYRLKLMHLKETSLQFWKMHTWSFYLEFTLLLEGKVYLFEAIQNPIFWFLFFSFRSDCYSHGSSLGMQVSVLQLSHLTAESLAHNFSSHKVQFPSWAIQDSWLLEEIFIRWAGISNLFKIPGVEIRKALVVVTMSGLSGVK